MNHNVLNTAVQEFIDSNLNSDITRYALKPSPFKDVSIIELIQQIEAKKRCDSKLPTWFNSTNIYYPKKINIEQTSSEVTAEYKASLISGKHIIDITAGFGVDSYYFSKSFENVTHCEINTYLSKIAAHNFKVLNINNITTLSTNGIEYLLQCEDIDFDWVYIDPSRRHDAKGKVFFLKDCIPKVPEHLKTIFKHTNHILIKTSPLLDITAGIIELSHVKNIHIVAVNNEVKELLWLLEKDCETPITIETVNIKSNSSEHFKFIRDKENTIKVQLSEPLTYLFEPNVAILKSGGYNTLSQTCSIKKLHKLSHLYTSKTDIDFPGRKFKIEKVIYYNKKTFKKLGILKANVTTRNFPLSVKEIRKTFKIKDGGENYIFFTTNLQNKKIIIICSKLG